MDDISLRDKREEALRKLRLRISNEELTPLETGHSLVIPFEVVETIFSDIYCAGVDKFPSESAYENVGTDNDN